MPNRTMGDSTTLGDIPLHVDAAMVYATGHFGVVTPQELNARFPHEHYGHAWVDATGAAPHVGIRDWETGDKSGSLEQWCRDHNEHSGKKDAVVYCNGSTIPEVRQLTGKLVLGKDYYLFVATLDGSPHKGEGIIACQRDGERQTGGHWDRSFIYDDRFWQPLKELPPDPHHPHRPSCRLFQAAVRAKIDNLWGAQTDMHANAMIAATLGEFPHGIPFTQRVVGTSADGIWGPKSKAHLVDTIREAQNALTCMGFNTRGADGTWGEKTDIAYREARKACHI
jgi:hypothetical protein